MASRDAPASCVADAWVSEGLSSNQTFRFGVINKQNGRQCVLGGAVPRVCCARAPRSRCGYVAFFCFFTPAFFGVESGGAVCVFPPRFRREALVCTRRWCTRCTPALPAAPCAARGRSPNVTHFWPGSLAACLPKKIGVPVWGCPRTHTPAKRSTRRVVACLCVALEAAPPLRRTAPLHPAGAS